MSITKSDLITYFIFPNWGARPGIPIARAYSAADKLSSADKVFKVFIRTHVPAAKQLITQLIHNHSITDVHQSLSINTIFSCFITELVEHYQNQLEQREEEIDKQLLDIKRLFAENSALPWDQNAQGLRQLFETLKKRLTREDALPHHFDILIADWRKLISTPHVGELLVVAFYEKTAAYSQIISEKKFAELGVCATEVPQSTLQHSFHLLLKQFSRDLGWISEEMSEKIPLLQDPTFELEIRHLTAENSLQLEYPVSTLVQRYIQQMRAFLNELVSLNIDDNEALRLIISRIQEVDKIMGKLKLAIELEVGGIITSYVEQIPIKISKDHIEYLKNYEKVISLKKSYLTSPLENLRFILTAFITTNKIWEERVEKRPLLASQISSLLPRPFNPAFADEFLASLTSSSPNKKAPVGQNVQKGNRKKQTEVVQPQKKSIPTPIEVSKSSVPVPIAKTKAIELLRGKLTQHQLTYPSLALRQVIWYLDFLIVIQNTKIPPGQTASKCLTVANAVTLYGQKVLEQAYRYCIKKEDAPLTKIHNLKTYHREFDPNFTQYPAIVKKLSMANNWSRYFYIDREKWHSLSTGIAKTPPILESLVKMAEGQALRLQELEQLVNETIEGVYEHVEFLLNNIPTPKSQASVVQNEGIALKESLDCNTFDRVSKKLSSLLTKSQLIAQHDVYLRIKQALAAIKMQKVSLEMMNAAKDIPVFSVWTTWSLLQLQEFTESILHSIEYFQDSTMSTQHDVKTLAAKVDLEIGELGEAFQDLSKKGRYPFEIRVNSVPGQIIDDLEGLKQHPEIMQGFELQGLSKMLWVKPSDGVSPDSIVEKLKTIMNETEEFLRLKALPALEKRLQAQFNTSKKPL